MTAALLKAARDFRRERARAALAALAIAVGLAALLACLSSYDILVRELNRGYLDTSPASAVLRTDALDDALLAQVRADPGVAAAELRGYGSGRIKAGPMQWRNLVLFEVPDFAHLLPEPIRPFTRTIQDAEHLVGLAVRKPQKLSHPLTSRRNDGQTV